MTREIPETETSVVLRTDYSDATRWEAICEAIRRPVGEFRAYVEFLSDPAYEGLTPEQVRGLVPKGSARTFIFIVDREALAHPDQTILVMDLADQPGRTFRVVPASMWSVENNLSISNMGFEEFADATDEHGIYRGFSD